MSVKSILLSVMILLGGCAHAPASMVSAEGKPFALGQLAGKVVLLDFFATWCEPCKATLPSAQRLAERLGPRGLVVYAVNTEKKADGALFLKGLGVTLPLLRDDDGVQAEALGGQNLPFAVLLDRHGTPRFRQEGVVDGGEERIGREAEKLLAEP